MKYFTLKAVQIYKWIMGLSDNRFSLVVGTFALILAQVYILIWHHIYIDMYINKLTKLNSVAERVFTWIRHCLGTILG